MMNVEQEMSNVEVPMTDVLLTNTQLAAKPYEDTRTDTEPIYDTGI
jgi:hypothetical protein